MFESLLTIAPYEDRKVARHESDDLIVSTCSNNDSDQPYETAVSHMDYNEGSWVCVELYDDEEAALTGHNKWIELMSAEPLPDKLVERSTSELAKMSDAYGNEFPRKTVGA